MIITITGAQGEGKTALANQITKGKSSFTLDASHITYKGWLLDINDDTEYLVVDGIVAEDLQDVRAYLHQSIKIRRPFTEEMTRVKMPPNIILISQD